MSSPSPTAEPVDLTAPLLLLGSTPADWLAALGGVASLAIATAAYFHSRAISKPRVEWRLDRGEKGHYELVQVGAGIEAVVAEVTELNGGSSLRNNTPAPRRLGQGAALLLHVDRALTDPETTEVEVVWREVRPGMILRGGQYQHRVFALA